MSWRILLWLWRSRSVGWKEISRFEPEAMTTGTLGHCWGDPSDRFDNVSQETGGDCSDDSRAANRDMLEARRFVGGLFWASSRLFDLPGWRLTTTVMVKSTAPILPVRPVSLGKGMAVALVKTIPARRVLAARWVRLNQILALNESQPYSSSDSLRSL